MSGQNPDLAKKYLDKGDLDKAAYEYRLLVDKFPYNDKYVFSLIKIYQSQSDFKSVEKLLKKQNAKAKPQYWVYLGYNYQLQKDSITARKYYQKAIKSVKKQAYRAYSVGDAFSKLYLLDEALQTYQTALQAGKNQQLYFKIAQIYAEKNDLEQMIANFLNYMDADDRYAGQVKYYLTRYITADPENEVNVILKNHLIERIKATHQAKWYRFLQWLYMQQKEYKKAFLQLKSLYRKDEAEISEIFHLAKTAAFNKKPEQAKYIYEFILNQPDAKPYDELAKLGLLQLDLKQLLTPEKKAEIQALFDKYSQENWTAANRITLQIEYAGFLAFHQNRLSEALDILDKLEKQALTKKQMAAVRLKKADILLSDEQFNQALILYTQVQLDFPNHPTGHQATYDIARASFFQGDIDWAHAQLKVIKSVADDLIANDAIDLDVLIINNKEEGDTLNTGLKTLARAKFEVYRKNMHKALQILDTIKRNFKGQLVYDDALLLQGKLYEQQQAYDKALEDYQAILDNNTEDLLKDDALFRMAVIYEKTGRPKQAIKLYKKIILEYPASFWFVDARKHFRHLRGDDIEEQNKS